MKLDDIKFGVVKLYKDLTEKPKYPRKFSKKTTFILAIIFAVFGTVLSIISRVAEGLAISALPASHLIEGKISPAALSMALTAVGYYIMSRPFLGIAREFWNEK